MRSYSAQGTTTESLASKLGLANNNTIINSNAKNRRNFVDFVAKADELIFGTVINEGTKKRARGGHLVLRSQQYVQCQCWLLPMSFERQRTQKTSRVID